MHFFERNTYTIQWKRVHKMAKFVFAAIEKTVFEQVFKLQ